MKNKSAKTYLSIWSLYKQLFIIAALVLVLAIGSNCLFRDRLAASIASVFAETVTTITEKLNEKRSSLDYVLLNQLGTDERIEDLETMELKDQIYYLNTIKNEFVRLKYIMDQRYNFFIYTPSYGQVLFDSSMSVEYDKASKVRSYLKTVCDSHGKALEGPTKQWVICPMDFGNILIRMISCGDTYVGCWFDFSLIEEEFQTANMQSCEVFAVRDGRVVSGADEYMRLSGADGVVLEEDIIGKYVGNTCFLMTRLDHSDYELLVSGSNFSIYKDYIIVQGCFVVLFGLILSVALYFLWVSQVKLIKPLKTFSSHLEEYVREPDIEHYFQFKELQEANEVFLKLGKQVKKLKFDMYEQEIEHQRIEMGYLQEQIKPHFYLNCLSIIYNMAQAQRYEEIGYLSMEVSGYLRFIFRNGMVPVSIREELEHINHYLNIQKIRYDAEFFYEIQGDEGAMDEKIPPLILQTLVENSVKYGIMREDPLNILVSIWYTEAEKEKYLEMAVSDSGPGFSDEILQRLEHRDDIEDANGRHIGLNNLCKRLDYMFQKKAEIIFENCGGARVTIRIPVDRILR